jgi:superoxide reductase
MTGGIYKCGICGNMVELIHQGGGTLVCCGEPMSLLVEQAADSSLEKHVPLIERVEGGYWVRVGSVPHPMIENHFIQWIELSADGGKCVHRLQPGQAPEAFFPGPVAVDLKAREYCNVHGLWKDGK